MRRDELKPDQLADALRGHTLGRGNERGRSDMSWWVYAVELQAEGEALGRIRKRSPQWDGQKPPIYINLSSKDPKTRFANNFRATRQKYVKKYGIRLRPDILNESGLTKEEAYRKLTEFNHSLREQGYGLLNSKPRRTHRVYVIDLDPAVRERREVRKCNPNYNPDMPCVYVGQTGLSLKKRRAQHRNGVNAGRGYVTKYGFGRLFLKELFKDLNPCLPEDSLKHERELAARLRAEGYTVTGGH